jgi:lipoprotein-releasing system permease protein
VYKLLLCWRYLLTRYLALACIISVMLGVATLIVVNSVMGGFSTKLKERLHGLLSDVLIEARSLDGFPDPQGKMERIRQSPIGQYIEAMTPTMEVFAMLQFRFHGEPITRAVRLIGIDPTTRAEVGGFSEYLKQQTGSPNPTFELRDEARARYWQRHPPLQAPFQIGLVNPWEHPIDPPPSQLWVPRGIIPGNAIVSYRKPREHAGETVEDVYLVEPGDDIWITTVGGTGERLAPVQARFALCDYFRSEMSEYDSNYVFVPLDYLQQVRGMENRVTSIQIKLTDYRHAPTVVDALTEMFPADRYMVETWEHKQGPLLAAIRIEKGILNVLLFLIIAVAGFGILAIFTMIVVEKTRDIGILKALGASNGGVMSIFLGYGLLLGVIGAILGTALGLTLTIYINPIEHWVATHTGQELFDKSVYYFSEIPTDIQAMSVFLVNVGAIAIAVIFSILPALRAAFLQPVRALRYE